MASATSMSITISAIDNTNTATEIEVKAPPGSNLYEVMKKGHQQHPDKFRYLKI